MNFVGRVKKKFEVGSIISIVYFPRLVFLNMRERDIFWTEFWAQKWKKKPSADPFMQSNRLVLQALFMRRSSFQICGALWK